PTTTAVIVASFGFTSAIATIACGFLPRRWPIRYPLALAAVLLVAASLLMPGIKSVGEGFLAVGLFGLGIGGRLSLTPISWADYFGRLNYGAIRGLALPTQVLAQAAGPLFSGVLYDLTGTYTISLYAFAALSVLALFAALTARPPRLG